MLITVSLVPRADACFTPNTILLHILIQKTENHKKITFSKNICIGFNDSNLLLNQQHLKKHKILDQVSTEPALSQGSDKFARAS